MSEQETLKGKLKRLNFDEGETLEDRCQSICIEEGYQYDSMYYESFQKCLEDEGGRDYIVIGKDIYKVIEYRDLSSGNIAEASLNPDGTVSFVLSYYNGGCSFNEAIEEALENMEKQ